jgi:ribosomal protein L16 Arg81 hydroxylase
MVARWPGRCAPRAPGDLDKPPGFGLRDGPPPTARSPSDRIAPSGSTLAVIVPMLNHTAGWPAGQRRDETREVVVLKGDLATTPLAAILTQLAESEALGCLHIEAPDGDEALVYVKTGRVYSIFLPGRRPQLAARLISSGALAPEALEEALEAQATELQGWRLGELLVHLGFVDKGVVEAFGMEQLRDGCFEMSRWGTGKWKFRKNEKTREDVAAALIVPELLDEVLRRQLEWSILIEVIGRVDAVPVLGAGGLACAEMALNQDQWALLCKVDGERSVHQLARDCGFTDFEAGQTVSALVMTGLLEMDGADADDGESAAEADLDGDDTEAEEYADDEPISIGAAAARLVAAFGVAPAETSVDTGPEPAAAPLGPLETAEVDVPAELPADPYQPYGEQDWGLGDDDSGSELSRLLGGQGADDADGPVAEPAAASADSNGYTSYALPDPGGYVGDPVTDDELPRYSVGFDKPSTFDESLSRVSEALSALLGAQTEDSDHQPDEEPSYTSTLVQPGEPEDAHERRVRDAAAAELATAQAEMDEQRRRFEDARHRAAAEAEQESARIAAAEDAERVAAEAEAARAAAEEAARVAAEEAARVAAEEEAARLAAEEAARIAAEEEAARVAAAAREAARVAAEEEAARAAAAEEAARAAAADEAARVAAAHEAARVAAAGEAARVAAAAEDAAHAAAAEEAAHQAAAEEAARVAAAADEAARVAAAEEAARVAAADEAARVVAADEAARVAAAEEHARRAAELSELEAAAAARLADEAARAGEEAAHAAAAEAEAELARVAAEHAARAAADEAARLAAEDAARAAAAENARAAAAEHEVERAAAEAAARAATEAAEFAALLAEAPPESPYGVEPAAGVPAQAASGLTDMASLMRELSSLGLEDEPAPAPPAPTRPSPPPGIPVRTPSAAQADKGKKRKGLFGRG